MRELAIMEQILIDAIKSVADVNAKALILQAYIAEFGPLPDDLGEIVKGLLHESP